MASIVIRNGRFALPAWVTSDLSLVIEDGQISGVIGAQSPPADAAIVDVLGATVLPGFVDIHTHGAVGIDVNSADTDGLLKIASFLAQNGVTAWLPTMVPDSNDTYKRVVEAVDRLMEMQVSRPIAQAVGIHYEGVFASEKMCGALRPQFFRKFTGKEIDELPRLKQGIHMTTLAPEVDGGIDLIRELRSQGWVVSLGHTRADTATLDAAYDAGAAHMTHFFNAMTGIHHRDIGVAGWGLINRGVTFDIIADGIHVDPKLVAFACRTKTPDQVTLISDSIAPTGLGDGCYQLWGETITVRNGRTMNERGSIAGSVSTMRDGVSNMRDLGFSDVEAAKMAASNPADLIGISTYTGTIEIGKQADLVAINAKGEVVVSIVAGKVAYENYGPAT